MKKIAIGCGIFLVLGIGALAFIFHLVFRPKYRDVSNEKPFLEIVNKKIVTKKPTLVLKYPGIPIKENYTFHLEDGNSFGINSDLEVLAEIPIGTEVSIDKVELHTGRVSGTTSAYLFGIVYSADKQETYAFQCTWGDYHVLYEDKPFWTFEQAFWQDEPLTEKYYIKVP